MDKVLQKKLRDLEEKMVLESRENDFRRARSITVGTCFGGTTEIMMRSSNTYLWTPMQPVEVVELINQLAANIGCNVALKPRKDFASWRDWRVTEEEKNHLNGWPPFVNDISPYNQVGAKGMDPELDKLLAEGGKIIESGGGAGGRASNNRSNTNETVAIEKPKNRRSVKRAAKAA